MARYRGTTEERGLGQAHRTDRQRLLALHHDGDPCWRCGQPMYKSQPLDRDHVIDRALGGAQGPAVLAHRWCNRGAGAKLGNQLEPRTIQAAGRDTICRTCSKPYHYAARICEICGTHYHPNYGQQRSCSRACGGILQRRTRAAKGSPAKPQPLCGTCGKACWGKQCHACYTMATAQVTRKQAQSGIAVYGKRRPVVARRIRHSCPGCGELTAEFRWCDKCLCSDVNAKGKRCGNAASPGGKCGYHAEHDGQLAAARQW
jgi:hypothetical protein